MVPAFRAPYVYAFAAAFAVWMVPEFVGTLDREDDGPDLDAKSEYGIYAAVAVTVAAGVWLAVRSPEWATWSGLAVPAFLAGVVVMVGGVALRWYSVRVLGAAFSRSVTVTDEQGVVDTGPYAVVRHPTYTGSLATLVGAGVAFGTWPALVVAVVAGGAAYGYRIRVEEAALRRELDGYDEYIERVPYRLVPGVY